MNSKLIILNGGKGAGKSIAVKALKGVHPNLVERRTKDKLFEIAMSLFNVPEEEFWRIHEDRKLKEATNDYFVITARAYVDLCKLLDADIPAELVEAPTELAKFRMKISIRNALIYVSELICKPALGQDYLGVARAVAIQDGEWALDDSAQGDMAEITPAIDKLGVDNVLCIRVHGRGDFSGDSRRFLPDDSLKHMVDITNDGSEQEFIDKIKLEVERWLQQ